MYINSDDILIIDLNDYNEGMRSIVWLVISFFLEKKSETFLILQYTLVHLILFI